MSPRFDWTLLSIQPVDCRPLLPISVYSGRFAPDFAPGFASEIDPKAFGGVQRSSTVARPKGPSKHFVKSWNRLGTESNSPIVKFIFRVRLEPRGCMAPHRGLIAITITQIVYHSVLGLF
jgi:hypothetical protein